MRTTRKDYRFMSLSCLSRKRLAQICANVHDPRRHSANFRHLLVDLLTITLFAIICDCDTWQDIHDYAVAKHEWLKTILELPHGIPSLITFRRFLNWMDPVNLENCYREWIKPYIGSLNNKHVCIDGKEICLAGKMANATTHIVSMYVEGDNATLGQVKVAEKANEIVAIPSLLNAFDLTGAVVSIDAMGCQREFAQMIDTKGGYYLFQVKGNQPTMYEEMIGYITWAEKDPIESKFLSKYTGHCGSHGRITKWEVVSSTEISWFESKKDWSGLCSVIKVNRTTTRKGKTSNETSIYISSYKATAKEFLKLIRGHWSIENRLHWKLDIVFREDKNKIHTGNAVQNLSTLRKMALAMLEHEQTYQASTHRKQRHACFDNDYVLNVIMS